MPELPEVEVLVRHLRPVLTGKTIRRAKIFRERISRPNSPHQVARALAGATVKDISRRGKFLLFELQKERSGEPLTLVGHLGMTGRMYVQPADCALPIHVAAVFDLGPEKFIFEDTRYFGRLTLDAGPLERMGPEPLSSKFIPIVLDEALKRSAQPIKVKLLDQTLVAGIGNIYASEVLFRAGISPLLAARRLGQGQVLSLWKAIREVLTEAIECGSTVPLNHSADEKRNGFFYFGSSPEGETSYDERLQVYGRATEACYVCGKSIKSCVQAARSTFYCSHCQTFRPQNLKRSPSEV